MWVFQPLDEHGILHATSPKGEGVHHIAVTTPNFHDVVAEQINVASRCPSAARSAGSTSPISRPTVTSG